VATRQLQGFFGVDAARIVVIKHAAPDLAADLPPLAPDRRRTAASHKYAANRLRQHAVEREWSYLVDFPFENVNYVAVSTQDRPSKNFPLIVEAVNLLNRRDYFGIKLFTTAALQEASVCLLPVALRETRLDFDFASMPDLPKAEHAAFYHCAAVTVHPSLFEGGATAFPFPESVSLGTPCLLARGPHTEELLQSYPELDPWVFDPYDADGLARLIRETIADRARVLAAQTESFERMRARSWAQVAGEYADFVVGNSQPSSGSRGSAGKERAAL
jgi:glycosyltransferase involved in cell wall biosynthesis